MHIASRFVTVASLSTASRLALGLRVRGTAGTTAATRARTSANSLRSSSSSTTGSSISSSNAGIGGESGETCVVSAALAFLEGKKRVVECLSPADYAAVDQEIGASVGAHMRHSLDHFSKCLAVLPQPGVSTAADTDSRTSAKPNKTIRYDHRTRGGTIETDPVEAAKAISGLLERLDTLPRGGSSAALLRRTVVSPAFFLGEGGAGARGEQEHKFESNLERELFFCCHHGTHHDAMIKLILGRMEGAAARKALSQSGESLGVAPSTVDFQQQQQQQDRKGKDRADA